MNFCFAKNTSWSVHLGYVMSRSMDERVSKWVRCMSHQADWIYYKQPIKFFVFVAGKSNRNYFYLLVSNGNSLTRHFCFLCAIGHVHSQNKQRSQSSSTSRKMFGPLFTVAVKWRFSKAECNLEMIFVVFHFRPLKQPMIFWDGAHLYHVASTQCF